MSRHRDSRANKAPHSQPSFDSELHTGQAPLCRSWAVGAKRSGLETITQRSQARKGCVECAGFGHMEARFLVGKMGRGRPRGWLEFWPVVLGRGVGVWTAERLLWNVHKGSRMKREKQHQGDQQGCSRDPGGSRRYRQGQQPSVRLPATQRRLQMAGCWPKGGAARVRTTGDVQNFQKENRGWGHVLGSSGRPGQVVDVAS